MKCENSKPLECREYKKKNLIKNFILVLFMLITINSLGWNIYLNERYRALETICFPKESLSVIEENREYIKGHYKEILKHLEELKKE